jgi:uncharacterized C2H2 Zn-finger protein
MVINCEECGATFQKYKSDQKFCCASHRVKYYMRKKTEQLESLKQENMALLKELEKLREAA